MTVHIKLLESRALKRNLTKEPSRTMLFSRAMTKNSRTLNPLLKLTSSVSSIRRLLTRSAAVHCPRVIHSSLWLRAIAFVFVFKLAEVKQQLMIQLNWSLKVLSQPSWVWIVSLTPASSTLRKTKTQVAVLTTKSKVILHLELAVKVYLVRSPYSSSVNITKLLDSRCSHCMGSCALLIQWVTHPARHSQFHSWFYLKPLIMLQLSQPKSTN